MKKSLLLLFVVIIAFASCKDSNNSKNNGENQGTVNQQKENKKKERKRRRNLSSSSGTINSISIIADDDLWKGDIGEYLRDKLTAPVKGLPQEEPLFSLSHIPPSAFSGFVRSSRNLILIEPSKEVNLKIQHDLYARPQVAITVSGPKKSEIKGVIDKNLSKIIRTVKNSEKRATQKRISKSLKNTKVLEDRFGLTMKLPSVYRYAKEDDDFVWLRKDISHGSMEILVYQVPLKTFEKDTNIVGSVIKMRDSIGEKYIPGPNKGTHMSTEKAYAPYLFETKVDNKFTYLTKGTWEVKDAFMAGPFVNYAIRDEKNNRYLILEGFVFKPQSPTKRNNIFELESIFETAKIR